MSPNGPNPTENDNSLCYVAGHRMNGKGVERVVAVVVDPRRSRVMGRGGDNNGDWLSLCRARWLSDGLPSAYSAVTGVASVKIPTPQRDSRSGVSSKTTRLTPSLFLIFF